jgi:hypothetical protein
MYKMLFALAAVISTPAYALDKCGPNYELPNDLTPVEIQVMQDFKSERERLEQLRIENNRVRDSLVNSDTLATLREIDRIRERQRQITNVGPEREVQVICMIRNGNDPYNAYSRAMIRSRFVEIFNGWGY